METKSANQARSPRPEMDSLDMALDEFLDEFDVADTSAIAAVTADRADEALRKAGRQP